MRLYLIRHGQTTRNIYGERVLSDHGRKMLRQNLEFIRPEIVGRKISVYTSPLKRAVESAEVLKETLGQDYKVMEILAGTSSFNLLSQLKEEDQILISHQPYISMWIEDLTGKSVRTSMGDIHLLKGDHKPFEFVY